MSLKPGWGLLLVIAIVTFPIFGHLDTLPIQLWDESRLAINAFEMYKTGNWIVTTYDWQPDMWNTKPPLLIWLEVLSFKAFGVNELALRLPCAIAGFLTCILIYWFFAWKVKRPWVGVLANVVLITSMGYIKYHHSPRTGDYDALLTLFCTGYCLFFYLFVEEGKRRYLLYSLLLLALATMTKGVAGILFTPALAIYALYRKKLLTTLKTPQLYIGILIFLLVVIGYYLLREKHNPGYIAAVKANELGGRYLETERKNGNEILYYTALAVKKNFLYWYLVFPCALLLGLASRDEELKRTTIFSALVSFFFFAVISIGKTKNDWYDMPIYPFWAICTGIGLYIVCLFLKESQVAKSLLKWNLLPLIFLFLLCYQPYKAVIHDSMYPDPGDWLAYNTDLNKLLKQVYHGQTKMDSIIIATDDEYEANIKWYEKVLKHDNRPITIANFDSVNVNAVVVTHKRKIREKMAAKYNYTQVDSFKNNVIVLQLNGHKE